MAGRLNFSGPFSGYFLFFIPRELARSLTADFLGEDPKKISQDHLSATVREIINMITGSTFSYFDDQAVFNLGIPELLPADMAECDDSRLDQEIFVAVKTEDSRFAMKMVQA